MLSLFQVPYYQGELITFDVVPSKLTFSVNYKSVVLKVRKEFMYLNDIFGFINFT